MKRVLIFILGLIISLSIYGQSSMSSDIRVANNTTTFGINLSVGTKVWDVNARKLFVAKSPVVGTMTLATGVAYFDEITGDNSSTNEIQDLSRTGDVLSLTNDGTTVDLSDFAKDSDFSGYVPYTGATSTVNLGLQRLDAATVNSKGAYSAYKGFGMYTGDSLRWYLHTSINSPTPTFNISRYTGTGTWVESPLLIQSDGRVILPKQLVLQQGTGTAPLNVVSTTKVTNLNSDFLDDLTGTYYDQRRYSDSTNYFGGAYVSGGLEKPNRGWFGGGKLKLQMLRGAGVNLPAGTDAWNDVLWLSSYSGIDVKQSTAIISGKNSQEIGFTKQNFDATDWGTYYKFWTSANANLSTVDWTTKNLSVNGTATGTQDATLSNQFVRLGQLSSYSSSNHTHKNLVTAQSTWDLNTIPSTNQNLVYDIVNYASTNLFPASSNANGLLSISTHGTGTYTHQLGFSSNGNMYQRHNNGTAWVGWVPIWTERNDGTGSGLSSDNVDGISSEYIPYGNYTTATTAWNDTVGEITKSGFYYVTGSFPDRPNNISSMLIHSNMTSVNYALQIGARNDRYWVRTQENGTWASWKELYHSGNFAAPANVIDNGGINLTANYIPKASDANTLTNSIINETSSAIGIGTTGNASGNQLTLTGDSWSGWGRTTGYTYNDIGASRTTGKAIRMWFNNDSDYGGFHVWGDAAGSSLVIKKGGNVGIGTTSPSDKFDVTGGNSIFSNYLKLRDYDGDGGTTSALISRDNALMLWTNAFVAGTYSNGVLPTLATGDILNAGNTYLSQGSGTEVVIGTTTNNQVDKLQVTGTGKFTGTVKGANATLSNEFVTLGQLPTIANMLTNSSTSTDNAIARFDGTTGKLIQNSGVIIDDNNSVTLGANGTTALFINLNKNDGGSNRIAFKQNNNLRWLLYNDEASETGSNAGSNFYFYRYNDAGSFLGKVFSINRASGDMDFGSRLSSSIPTGTAPFPVTSTTVNTNFNADLLDGISSEYIVYGNNLYATNRIDGSINSQINKSGFYFAGSSSLGRPDDGYYNMFHSQYNAANYYGMQIAAKIGTANLYFRTETATDSIWNTWNTIFHSGNSNLSTVQWNVANATLSTHAVALGQLPTLSTIIDNGGTNLTAGYLPKATDANTLSNSPIYTNGTNTGIGTTNPVYRLQVEAPSPVYIAARTTDNLISETAGLVLQTRTSVSYDGTIMGLKFSTSDSGKPIVFANNIGVGLGEYARFSGDGKLGIGVTSPSQFLDVNGNARFRSIGTTLATSLLGVIADGTLTTNVILDTTDIVGLQEFVETHSISSYTETDPIFGAHTVKNIADGTGFLKNTAGVWSYDNSTYSLSTHTHSGIYEVPLTFSTGLNRIGNTITSTITQYTDALARGAISLTTTGNSGASTYSSTTGILNVPTYTLAGLGGIALTSLSSTATGLTYTNTTGVFSLTSGYIIPTTSEQTNWNTAYSDRMKWDGGSTGLVPATGRTSLGATTIGGNIFTSTNPSAITFLRANADNTVSWLDAATFRTAIGAGTSSTNGTVTSVAMTVPTGLSISGTPITTSGTLAVTLTSGYSIPTTANQTNWNTAYGWGNHATQGYLTQTSFNSGNPDLAAIEALAGTTGLLKKTAANTWTLDNSVYLTNYTEIDPIWTAAINNYYTKTNLQTSGQASVHWDNITNEPTFLTSYTETDPVFTTAFSGLTAFSIPYKTLIGTYQASNYTMVGGKALIRTNPTSAATSMGDFLLQVFGASYSTGQSYAGQDATTDSSLVRLSQVYTKTNLQTSGQASIHWDNITNEPTFLTGNQTITISGDASGSGTTAITLTVADDSHNHNGTTISGLSVADFTSPNISNWTNDANYADKDLANTFLDDQTIQGSAPYLFLRSTSVGGTSTLRFKDESDLPQFSIQYDSNNDRTLMTSNNHYISTQIGALEVMNLATTGQLKLPQYTGTTFDGTITKYLGVDASGNVVKGTVSTGTTNHAALSNLSYATAGHTDFVSTNTTQTISAVKTFSANPIISANDGNLRFTGTNSASIDYYSSSVFKGGIYFQSSGRVDLYAGEPATYSGYFNFNSEVKLPEKANPVNTNRGTLYFDTDDNTFRGYNGSSWVDLGSSGGSMVYPSAGIPVSNGSAWLTSVSGTALQVLRRNAGNTAYEFYTLPAYLTSEVDGSTGNELNISMGYTASTRTIGVTDNGGTKSVVLPLFTSTEDGLTPSSGGGTTNFLRADGTWAAPTTSSKWQQLTGAIAPVTITDEVRIGGSGDAGNYLLQVTGNTYISSSIVTGVNVQTNELTLPERASGYTSTSGYGGLYYQTDVGLMFKDENSNETKISAKDNDFTRFPMLQTDFLGPAGAGTAEAAWGFDYAVIASGTQAKIASEANHPGILRTSSSTTTNSGGYCMTDNASVYISGGEVFECIFQPRVASNTNTTIRVGFMDSYTSTAPVDGCYFELATGTLNIVGINRYGTTNTTSTAPVATLTVNTWYRLKIEVNSAASSVTYTVYNSSGTVLGTQTNTGTIPTGSTGRETGCGVIATNSGTTATLLAYWDMMSFYYNKPLVR